MNNSTATNSQLMSLNKRKPVFNSFKNPATPSTSVKKISCPETEDFNNASFFKDFTWHEGKSNFGWSTNSTTLSIQPGNFNDQKKQVKTLQLF